jgi:hypothetical protein
VEVIDDLAPTPTERVFYNWPFNGSRALGFMNIFKSRESSRSCSPVWRQGCRWERPHGHCRTLLQSDHPADASTDGNPEVHRAVTELILPAIGLVPPLKM